MATYKYKKGQNLKKISKIGVGGFSRTKVVEFDPTNYSKKGIMAGVVYGKGKYPIKKKKTIITQTPKKTKVKTVKYGPIGYYGKQKKTKTIKKGKFSPSY